MKSSDSDMNKRENVRVVPQESEAQQPEYRSDKNIKRKTEDSVDEIKTELLFEDCHNKDVRKFEKVFDPCLPSTSSFPHHNGNSNNTQLFQIMSDDSSSILHFGQNQKSNFIPEFQHVASKKPRIPTLNKNSLSKQRLAQFGLNHRSEQEIKSSDSDKNEKGNDRAVPQELEKQKPEDTFDEEIRRKTDDAADEIKKESLFEDCQEPLVPKLEEDIDSCPSTSSVPTENEYLENTQSFQRMPDDSNSSLQRFGQIQKSKFIPKRAPDVQDVVSKSLRIPILNKNSLSKQRLAQFGLNHRSEREMKSSDTDRARVSVFPLDLLISPHLTN